MKNLLEEIRSCKHCKSNLPYEPNPILSAKTTSKIVIIGQAPGRIVNETSIPWNDASGERLRNWLGVTKNQFYNSDLFALIPMGFCFPGTGKNGDLPPRKECAPLWHEKLLESMPDTELIILIGNYAQKHYLKKDYRKNLTTTVSHFENYLPNYFVLPHPSPRNNIWIKKNPWFEINLLPILELKIKEIIS